MNNACKSVEREAVAEEPPHVVFLAGDDEYRSEESLPMLASLLQAHYGFKVSLRYTVDPDILAELGVPRSTVLGWLHRDYQRVVTADVLDMDHIGLQAEVLRPAFDDGVTCIEPLTATAIWWTCG